jgi:hypothetical protein
MTNSGTQIEDGESSMTTKFQSKAYFEWLYSLIAFPENGKTYFGLLAIMQTKEFVWVVGNDDNRIQDGRDLRYLFLNDQNQSDLDPSLVKVLTHVDPVSVLEVLIGLSARIAFLTNVNSKIWAWKLIENLGIHKAADPLDQEQEDRVNDILDTLIWRTYDYDGSGGFFPLKDPEHDQTTIEIWYQMAAYIEEHSNRYI